MIDRIFCAIFGHRWHGAGWLGVLINNDAMMLRYCCDRCKIYVNVQEPGWHIKARYHKKIDKFDVPIIFPNKFRIDDPNYNNQLELVNRKYPLKVLADIHNTTVKELKKIGY